MKIAKPAVKHIYNIWAVILLIWAIYRGNFPHNPEFIDELIFKPLVFLGPVLWYVKRVEKRPLSSIGFAKGKLLRDIKIGVGIGLLFALEGIFANWIKYGELNFAPVVPVAGGAIFIAIFLSLVTALIEETLARGFIFGRLLEYYNNELRAVVVGAAMFLLLHVPIMFTALKLTGINLVIFIVTDIIIAVATSVFYAETKTLTVPVLVHAFWNMTVALYL